MTDNLNKTLEQSTGTTASSGGTIEQIQQEFKEWLFANTAVIGVLFENDMQINIKLKPEKYTTVENVWAIAYTIAAWYATRTKKEVTICAVFMDNDQLYTSAIYKRSETK